MPVRSPAVAGSFYESRPEALDEQVRRLLPTNVASAPAIGAIVPHAGFVYSGPVAGEVYARIRIPKAAIVLCPNHTGRGAAAALDPSVAWRTPIGDVPLARGLADRLLQLAPRLEPDSEAHRREHSLEVQLPFLRHLRPDVEIVPVCIGEPSLALCREIGEAAAKAASAEADPPVILASSDMSHYEPRRIGRARDDRALERVEALDAEGLFRTVRDESISMCGFLPATALLFAARALDAKSARVVARRDSGDETGDESSVVGYAGVVIT
jgi:AmmeMemoRadiSam system protein B